MREPQHCYRLGFKGRALLIIVVKIRLRLIASRLINSFFTPSLKVELLGRVVQIPIKLTQGVSDNPDLSFVTLP